MFISWPYSFVTKQEHPLTGKTSFSAFAYPELGCSTPGCAGLRVGAQSRTSPSDEQRSARRRCQPFLSQTRDCFCMQPQISREIGVCHFIAGRQREIPGIRHLLTALGHCYRSLAHIKSCHLLLQVRVSTEGYVTSETGASVKRLTTVRSEAPVQHHMSSARTAPLSADQIGVSSLTPLNDKVCRTSHFCCLHVKPDLYPCHLLILSYAELMLAIDRQMNNIYIAKMLAFTSPRPGIAHSNLHFRLRVSSVSWYQRSRRRAKDDSLQSC